MARLREIEAILRSGLGDAVAVAASGIDHGWEELWPEERPHVDRAIDKRRREFATSRVLARSLLVELGLPEAPIGQAEDRSPIWPEGVVGSISHTQGLCVVAAAKAKDARAIGLDVEAKRVLKDELHNLVLRPEERRWLSTLPERDRGEHAMLIFSAKECTYKCQYPLTRVVMEFEDVELSVDRARLTYSARIFRPEVHAHGIERVEGFYRFTGPAILSGMILH